MTRLEQIQQELNAERQKVAAAKEEQRQKAQALREKQKEELQKIRRKQRSKERALRRERQRAEDHARYQLMGEMVRDFRETGKSPDLFASFKWLLNEVESGTYRGDSKDVSRLLFGLRLLGQRMMNVDAATAAKSPTAPTDGQE